MAEPQLVVQTLGDVVVVDLGSSTVLDASTIDAVGRKLYELVEKQAHRKIILDFSQVRFLSSMILGVLIRLRKRSAAINGRVVLCGLRPELHKVFKISKLDSLFEFYPNEEEALKSFDVYMS